MCKVVRYSAVGLADEFPGGVEGDHPRNGLVARGPIRVVFLGQPAIGSLDDLVLSLRIDLEDLVWIRTVGHPTQASAAARSGGPGGSGSGIAAAGALPRMNASASSGPIGGSSTRWKR
jgi:hypothetical protein